MYRMIVKRGDPEYFELLYRTFSERLPVVWERRKKDRRRSGAQATGGGAAGSAAEGAGGPGENDERRRQERRGAPPATWTGLGFVVVRSAPQTPERVRRFV